MHTLASEWRDAAALETPVDVGTPDVVGALAVFPLLSRTTGPPAYRSLAAALEHGASIEEAPAASVGALIVHNPLHLPVLLYEGQEVLGARQNRVFASSALVPAGASLRVPVTCVERHRWDDRRHREPLKLSSHTTHPTLRGLSHQQKAAGRHAVQTAVWESVSATLRHHRVDSSHQAMDDLYEARRVDLHAVARAIGLRDGQVGTLAAISGRFAVLDHVSQPTAFYRLKNPLVIGYALDALTAPEAAPPSQADGRDFVELLWRSPRTRTPAVGLGDTLMFGFGGLAGIGLEWSGKTITLTAYA